MVRQCRAQMPLYRPEPFIAPGTSSELGDAIGVNVDALTHHQPAIGDDLNYNSPNAPFMQLVTKPLRRRPPAQIFVGQPLRPISPCKLILLIPSCDRYMKRLMKSDCSFFPSPSFIP